MVKISLDTKEIKGGREELVLRPPGAYVIETFDHTGKITINKRYNLSYTERVLNYTPVCDHKDPFRKKRFIDKISANVSAGPELRKLRAFPDLGHVWADILGRFWRNILNPLEQKDFAEILGEWYCANIDEALRAFQDMPENAEATKRERGRLQVVFFRSMDPTSLYLWNDRRMTGFNISWHLETEDGARIEVKESQSDYLEKNGFFIRWINFIAKARSEVGEKKVWDAIKNTRAEFVKRYQEFIEFEYRRIKRVMVADIDVAAWWMSLKKFHGFTTNKRGDLTQLYGEEMIKTMETHVGLDILDKNESISSEELSDSELLSGSKMFLYLFSLPRNKELSLVSVWESFYQDLFSSSPRIIIQTLANIIKQELQSRRNKDSVAEEMFGRLDKMLGLGAEYGKLDILMSTKDDIFNRRDRFQFQSLPVDIETVLGSISDNLNLSKLGRLNIILSLQIIISELQILLHLKSDFSDNEENKRMINHPVHIIDGHGKLMPSAFIPFCFLGTNLSSLGTKVDGFSQPVCTKFIPMVLEGQLCYQLDLEKQGNFLKGEENGLTIFLDYNEDKSLNKPSLNKGKANAETLKLKKDALIYIDTLGTL